MGWRSPFSRVTRPQQGLLPSVRKVTLELSRSRFNCRYKLTHWLGSTSEANLPRTLVGIFNTSLQSGPDPSLFSPVERLGDGADIFFDDWIAATLGAREEEDLFLDVGGEVQEHHDLGHARWCDVAEVGEFRLVGNDAVTNQLVAADCECHEAGNARDAASGNVLGGTISELLAAVVSACDVKFTIDC